MAEKRSQTASWIRLTWKNAVPRALPTSVISKGLVLGEMFPSGEDSMHLCTTEDQAYLHSMSSSLLTESFVLEDDVQDQTLYQLLQSKRIQKPQVCSICTKNKFPSLFLSSNTSVDTTKQLFWDTGRILSSREGCSGCRLISDAMGDLLYKTLSNGVIVGRVEHFATNCKNMSEARRLWLSLAPIEETPEISMKGSFYNQRSAKQEVEKKTICCIQEVRVRGTNRYDLFSGRFVDPNGVAFSLVKRWLDMCEKNHRTTCGSKSRLALLPQSLRVVDVSKGRIVTAPANCRYLALSYVWGDFNQLQLNSITIDTLSMEGVLFDDDMLNSISYQNHRKRKVPKTIKDAILLCQQLGERYLWVDSLCILQDNQLDKHTQISQMDAIYREAALTIVAAAGANCDHGLPGVSWRATNSHVALVNDVPLSTTQRDAIQLMFSSKWNQRAWTLQEKILSTRLLVFTSKIVFFYCTSALWREDIALEEHAGPDVYLNEREMLDAQILDLSVASQGYFQVFTDFYSPLVTTFVRRELSRDEDAVDAFSGISRSLEPALGPFWCGLPSRLLGISLLWRSASETLTAGGYDEHKYSSSWVRSTPIASKSIQRSLAMNNVETATLMAGHPHFIPENPNLYRTIVQSFSPPDTTMDPNPYGDVLDHFNDHIQHMRREDFPSWSWAGWKHRSDSRILFTQPMDARSLLTFFEVTAVEAPRGAPDDFFTQSGSRYTPRKREYIGRMNLFQRCGIDVYRVLPEIQDHLSPPERFPPIQLPASQMSDFVDIRLLPRTNLLVFYTSASIPKISSQLTKGPQLAVNDLGLEAEPDYMIRTSFGLTLATLPGDKLESLKSKEMLELIVIACTLDGQLLLLLIEWVGDIAYRVPYLELELRISMRDWMASKPYQKRVVLG